jgi:UDP-N-acetylmuramate-alanine ligase
MSRLRDGDVVVTMGAGSIANLAPELSVGSAPPSVAARG